ncbi:MAG: gamma-glutamyltransferase, partial [Burkholderiales bacterium]
MRAQTPPSARRANAVPIAASAAAATTGTIAAAIRRSAGSAAFAVTIGVTGSALASGEPPAQPEASSGFVERSGAQARRFMAVTANPHASHAAYDVLAAGGSAVDAAIAAQMVLTLVEPQSSGIGGGGFMLHYDSRTRRVRAYDGRETAPAAATASLFVDADGRPMPFFDAVVGGRAVGVPGLVRMLETAHVRHGRLPWKRLFAPAIRLAREGFEVSPRLHALLAADRYLREDPAAAALFYDAAGHAWPAGHRLRNPALAETLSQIASDGSLALHAGEIARDIVAAVRAHPRNA